MRTCFAWIVFFAASFLGVAPANGSEALALQERLLEVYEQQRGDRQSQSRLCR